MPNTSSEYLIEPESRPWQLALRRFFAKIWVELMIGLLVVISVNLTLLEFALEVRLKTGDSADFPLLPHMTQWHLDRIVFVNNVITGVFILELFCRFLAATSYKKYFSEFWLDILATIPVFRVFRSVRALRLLRLIRLFRLVGVLSRMSSHFPHIFRRGAVEFVVITGFLVIAVLFGTASMMYFENAADGMEVVAQQPGPDGDAGNREKFTMERSFWFSVYTMFAGEPVPAMPKTIRGKIVSVVLMFMGLAVFAIIAGTISAFMTDRIRVEARVVEWDDLADHIIICGWTPKTETIIREYRANKATRTTPIVVIAQGETDAATRVSKEFPRIFLIDDDFTKVSALKRAGIQRCTTCLILSCLSGGRSEQDADARTILAALTVEKISPDVYTCAELINRSYSTHLEMGNVNNFVVSEEYGAYMLAQASIHHGLAAVMNELLSYQKGNEFYRCAIPEHWIGKSFVDMLLELKNKQDAILVGVHPAEGEMLLNPTNYEFKPEDEVVAICRGGLKLS